MSFGVEFGDCCWAIHSGSEKRTRQGEGVKSPTPSCCVPKGACVYGIWELCKHTSCF